MTDNRYTIFGRAGGGGMKQEEIEELIRDIAYEKEDEIFIGKTTDDEAIIVLDGDEEGVNITPNKISFDTPDGENYAITPEKIKQWDSSKVWYGTQAEFDALSEYDETGETQYFISDKLDYKTDIKNLPLIPKKVSELPNDAHYLQGVKKINGISMRGEGDVDIMKIINEKTVYLTQEEFDALEEKDAEKLYIIEGEGGSGSNKEITNYYFEDYQQDGMIIKEEDLTSKNTLYYNQTEAILYGWIDNTNIAEIQMGRYIYSFQRWDDEEGTIWYRWVDNEDFKKEEIATGTIELPTTYRFNITGYGETENVSTITGYKVLDVDTSDITNTLNQFVADNLPNYITNGVLKPFEFVLFEQQDYGYDREYNAVSSANITLTSQTTASITISANTQIEGKLFSFNAIGSINARTMSTTWSVIELSEGSVIKQTKTLTFTMDDGSEETIDVLIQ